MRTIGWMILGFYFMMTALSDHWEVYAGMLVGLSLIVGSYYLNAKR